MNLTLILFLNFFVPTQIVIPNTIGDVVNSGGEFMTYKVLDRFKDSILLSRIYDINEIDDSILIHRDLLDFRINYGSLRTLSSVDKDGVSLGVDTFTNQDGNTYILPKRKYIERDYNFLSVADTICFLVPPKERQTRFSINSVFGIINNRIYVLEYSYPDSATDFCFRNNRSFKSYNQLKEVIGKMISYRDIKFDTRSKFTLTKAYKDFLNYFEIEDFHHNDLVGIGANLIFMSKTFERIKGLKIKNRLNGFYELDNFALNKFPHYIGFRHIDIMPINDTKEFKKAVILVAKNKWSNDSNSKLINRFILNYLDKKENDSVIRAIVDDFLSSTNLNEIFYAKDIRLIMNYLEQ